MVKFFSKQEHKRFNLTPRYWDPEKEEREEREKRIKVELGIKDDNDTYIPNMKGKFTSQLNEKHSIARSARRNSTVRLFFILIILLLIAFYLIFKLELLF